VDEEVLMVMVSVVAVVVGILSPQKPMGDKEKLPLLTLLVLMSPFPRVTFSTLYFSLGRKSGKVGKVG